MKKLLLVPFMFAAMACSTASDQSAKTSSESTPGSPASTLTAEEQAKIYLISGYDLALGLEAKVEKMQYYACNNTEALLLINKAFETDGNLAAAANKIDPWTARNLSASTEQLQSLAKLCKENGIEESEKAEALKLANRIGINMSLE